VCALILAAPLVRVANAQAQDDASAEAVVNSLGDSQADLVYTPVTPCRIIDTRLAGGAIAAGTTRSFKVTGDTTSQGGANCGIPYGPTTAAVVNFVAVNPGGAGNLRVTPFGAAMPLASIINFTAGLNLANGLVVATCNPSSAVCTSDITIQADVSATNLVADVQGYFRSGPALNTASVSYSLEAGADSAPITPAANAPVLVMGCQTALGFRGVSQVTLLRIPGNFLEWVGLESTAGAAITQGFSATPGTHILWLDFAHQVDLRVSSADTFVVHNGSSGVRTGVVKLIW
jgi:hypothetical protein